MISFIFQIYRATDAFLLLEISVATTTHHIFRIVGDFLPNDGECLCTSESRSLRNQIGIYLKHFAGELDIWVWKCVVYIHSTDYSLLHGVRREYCGNSPKSIIKVVLSPESWLLTNYPSQHRMNDFRLLFAVLHGIYCRHQVRKCCRLRCIAFKMVLGLQSDHLLS